MHTGHGIEPTVLRFRDNLLVKILFLKALYLREKTLVYERQSE